MKRIIYLFIASMAFVAVIVIRILKRLIPPNSPSSTDPNCYCQLLLLLRKNVCIMQVGGDMGLCWAQHWSKVQYNDEEKYIPRRALMNAVWTNLYAGVIAESKSAYDLAGEAGNTNLQGVF